MSDKQTQAAREMTLAEWVDRLPPKHKARTELAALTSQPEITHPTLWDDDGSAGLYICLETGTRLDMTINTDDDPLQVCTACGKTLKLDWRVHVEAADA